MEEFFRIVDMCYCIASLSLSKKLNFIISYDVIKLFYSSEWVGFNVAINPL